MLELKHGLKPNVEPRPGVERALALHELLSASSAFSHLKHLAAETLHFHRQRAGVDVMRAMTIEPAMDVEARL
jgi:hypothetical protein